MRSILILGLTLFHSLCFSQNLKFEAQDISISKWIDGTLLLPVDSEQSTLAIIIAGSGPTNRDGNQNFLKNNSLKKLAESLSTYGVATFRYDKRIVKQIVQNTVDPKMMFDDFVLDAETIITYFSKSDQFNKIYIIGHSQGSLVGMLAVNENVDGFISLAGAGQNIGDILLEQIAKTAPDLKEESASVITKLKKGQTTSDYPEALYSVFNEDLQPFMINWMQYNPTKILSQLTIPSLVINGTKDLQVSVKEAELLAGANPQAELQIIQNMNHVLFEIEGDDLENSKSYNETIRPISKELIRSIVNFMAQ
jgi:esterase/lipase